MSVPLQVGLMVEPQLGSSWTELLDIARWAEDAGFDTFARSDHYLDMAVSRPVTDALTSMAALAVETDRIGLIAMVTPITFRHPAVIAKTATTLHEISGGRFELGVGTGWMEGEHEAFGIELPPWRERFDRFEEALAYLSAALGRVAGPFKGDHFQLGDFTPHPSPGHDLRIVIGGTGPVRTPDLAGRFADELNLFGADPAIVADRIAATRSAAGAARRDPDAVTISTMVNPLLGTDRADYEERLGARLARRGEDRDALLARFDQRGIPYGPVDEAAERFAAIAALGFGRIYLQQFDALADIDRENARLALAVLRSL